MKRWSLSLLSLIVGAMVLAAPMPSSAAPAPAPETSAVAPLDLNLADAEALTTLPGIGPARARAIVEYRDANGRFGVVDELTRIKGIGASLVEELRERVVVSPADG